MLIFPQATHFPFDCYQGSHICTMYNKVCHNDQGSRAESCFLGIYQGFVIGPSISYFPQGNVR